MSEDNILNPVTDDTTTATPAEETTPVEEVAEEVAEETAEAEEAAEAKEEAAE